MDANKTPAAETLTAAIRTALTKGDVVRCGTYAAASRALDRAIELGYRAAVAWSAGGYVLRVTGRC